MTFPYTYGYWCFYLNNVKKYYNAIKENSFLKIKGNETP